MSNTHSASSTQAAWIDSIVERVVATLRREMEQGGETSGDSAAPAHHEPNATDRLELNERVITLESLRGRLGGVRTLVVSPQAIVTPAVRDELKDRGVELLRESLGKPADSDACSRHKAAQSLIACWTQGGTQRLDPELLGVPVRLQSLAGQDWSGVRERIAAEVTRERGGVLIALEPYRAVVELNREPRLTAGYAPTSSALGKLLQQLRPNVVVVDARRITHGSLREVAEGLRRQR